MTSIKSTLNLIKSDQFIHGEWTQGSSTTSFKVLQKYSGKTLANIKECSESLREACVESSIKGFEELKNLSSGDRSQLLMKLAQKIVEYKQELIELICAEAAKPMSYALSEVERTITTFTLAAEEAKRICGEVVPMDYGAGEGKIAMTSRFPIGPVLGISPFNFPLNLIAHKVAPALAVGCSIIIKPSPFTPLTALFLAGLINEVGFPKGSVNVVNLSIDDTEKLVKDDRLKALSFTGSDRVGWLLKSKAGKKKVTLELGGNAAVVIDKKVSLSLKALAKKVCSGAFLYSGQICISTQRVIIHEDIYEEFKKELISYSRKIVIGSPEKQDTIISSLIDSNSLKRIESSVQQGIKDGAKLLCGGEVYSAEKNIYTPTILEGVNRNSNIFKEEIFGPVMMIESFKESEHAIERVNDSRFGLQVGVFSDDVNFIKEVFNNAHVGAVVSGSVPGFRVDQMPYGGIKDSGHGREGLVYAMSDMTDSKLLVF